ncbi:MAG: hypothetical protein JXJ04_07360, partial [Spirochaetales bacterium]|nr:hypothetical protein [Spirochaetales bacterium]
EIGWNFLTYVKTGTNSATGNFMDFVNDCISRGYAQSSWYVHDFEAGFEIMSGGEGLTANSFSFSVSTGGTTTPAPTNPPTITNPPAITNPPSSGDNSLVVRARGTNGDEQIRLKVDNNTIATFNLNTSYGNYTASTNSGGNLSVEFFNDGSGKDVQVDYIQINGSTRQAEDQSSNTAVWQNSSCGGSYSEWMHCNGEISFGDISGGTTTPAPTSPPVITNPPVVTNPPAVTNPPVVTNPPAVTNPPGSGETCSGGISKSIPFTQDGAGNYCFEIASINYINSWNMTKLTVNGVDFTNKWASNLPAKINGLYYIVYDGNVGWCHFEAK